MTTPRRNLITRRRLLVASLLAVGGGGAAAVVYRHRIRDWLRGWENTGDFAGPLDRPAPRYDPSKPPSRPWLDPTKTAPPPTTYQAYAASTLNGASSDFLLYLPPGYDAPANAARRYPVVYWLHGYSVEPQHGTPFVEGLDAAIRAGVAPPAIVVLPNGLFDSWYVNSVDGSQPVESVVMNDLIPHVDRTWRTIADRRGRALEGFSMGGWGALHLALKHPDTFGAVTSVSAPFHKAHAFPQIHRIFRGDHAAYYAEDPVTRARRNAAQLRAAGVRIRLLCGDEDEWGNDRYNRALARRLTQWQVPHALTIVPGASHNDGEVYEKMGQGGRGAFGWYAEVFGRRGRGFGTETPGYGG